MNQIRVLLADDHRLLREAFAQLLELHCDIVGTAEDGAELLAKAPAARPDVVVLDIGMPKVNGIDAARKLRQAFPRIGIVFLTVSEDPDLAADALEAAPGASFLLKNSAGSELVRAIGEAKRGRSYISPQMAGGVLDSVRHGTGPRLTPRQREVLQLLAEGMSMKAAAHALGITARTVAHHKYTMMETLGIDNTAQLIRYAARRGLTK